MRLGLISNRLRIASCLLGLLACLSTRAVATNLPAHLWFSFSNLDPLQSAECGGNSLSPHRPDLSLSQGTSKTLYLWAQPEESQGQVLTLQNLSLNVRHDAGVSIDDFDFVRPDRFVKIVDTTPTDWLTLQNGPSPTDLITYPIERNGKLERLAAYNVIPSVTAGIGGTTSGSVLVPPGPGGRQTWLLATMKVRAVATSGMANISLEVGHASITHSNPSVPFSPTNPPLVTTVRFGHASDTPYDSASDRQMWITGDTPDVVVTLGPLLPGDINGDGVVDLLDLDLLGRGFGRTGANRCDGDLNGDNSVDLLDLDILGSNFGQSSGGSRSVPEPTAWLVAMGAIGLLTLCRCGPRGGAAALLLLVGFSDIASAQIDSTWINPAGGNWDEPTNWSTPSYPDNDGANHTAIIGGIATFDVLLEIPISIDGLSLSNPQATLVVFDTNLTVNDTVDPILGTISLAGSTAGFTSFLGEAVINEQTIRAETSVEAGLNVSPFDNRGTVDVVSGLLTITSQELVNTGVFQVASGARLELFSLVDSYQHTGTAVLQGSGTFSARDLNTFPTRALNNNALVRPGDSLGILTIDGNYTQGSAGVLEIEVGGLVAGTSHDRLVATGAATLAGRLDVPITPTGGVFPLVGQSINVLSAASRVGEFDSYRFTGLPTNVAQQISYTPTGVDIAFVDTTSTALANLGGIPGSWDDMGTWNNGVPNSTTIVSVVNNFGGPPNTVNVTGPAEAHRVIINGTNDVFLSINDASLSVSTTTDIGENGSVILSGSAQLTSETVLVSGGGTLAGAGRIVADVAVGVGPGQAVFDPSGLLNIEGDYTQEIGGLFAAEISAAPFNAANDLVTVTGDLSLSGALQIDVSDLLNDEFSLGDTFELIRYDGDLTGAFDTIDIVGRDDLFFEIAYEQPSMIDDSLLVTIQASCSSNGSTGDLHGDGVDAFDAAAFAAVLIDNQLTRFVQGQNASSGPWPATFDFDRTTAGSNGVIDFYDVPNFVGCYAIENNLSMAHAYADLSAAIELARRPVPEPASALLVGMVLGAACVMRRRQ